MKNRQTCDCWVCDEWRDGGELWKLFKCKEEYGQ